MKVYFFFAKTDFAVDTKDPAEVGNEKVMEAVDNMWNTPKMPMLLSRNSKEWHLQWRNDFQQITRQRLVGSWWFFRQSTMKFQFRWNAGKTAL